MMKAQLMHKATIAALLITPKKIINERTNVATHRGYNQITDFRITGI